MLVWYNKIPTSFRAASHGRKQFQFSQAFLGGIGIQGYEKPVSTLVDKKGNRNTEAEPTPFLGNGEYAYKRDKEPPSACDWRCKTEAGTCRTLHSGSALPEP
jgi:hypothetical protein